MVRWIWSDCYLKWKTGEEDLPVSKKIKIKNKKIVEFLYFPPCAARVLPGIWSVTARVASVRIAAGESMRRPAGRHILPLWAPPGDCAVCCYALLCRDASSLHCSARSAAAASSLFRLLLARHSASPHASQTGRCTTVQLLHIWPRCAGQESLSHQRNGALRTASRDKSKNVKDW